MHQSLKSMVINAARSLGYELSPAWRKEKLALAELIAEIFSRHQIDAVLDIGANKGQFAQFLRLHVGYQGRIISFEPISENIATLRKLAAMDGHWDIVGHALGREDAVAELNVMKADVFSSFLKPNATSDQLFSEWNVVDHAERVKVRRLDGLLSELGLDPANKGVYLKTDTQGYDLDVLAGCGDRVAEIRALQTEVSVIPIYDCMPTMSDSMRELRERDFGLAGLFPVSLDSQLRVVEFDAVS